MTGSSKYNASSSRVTKAAISLGKRASIRLPYRIDEDSKLKKKEEETERLP